MSNDHIVIKYDVQPPVIKCLHCGYEQVLALPMSVIVAMGYAFTKDHRNCKKK